MFVCFKWLYINPLKRELWRNLGDCLALFFPELENFVSVSWMIWKNRCGKNKENHDGDENKLFRHLHHRSAPARPSRSALRRSTGWALRQLRSATHHSGRGLANRKGRKRLRIPVRRKWQGRFLAASGWRHRRFAVPGHPKTLHEGAERQNGVRGGAQHAELEL